MTKDKFITTALELAKARLGISTTVRDALLVHAIKAIVEELSDEKGLTLDYDSALQLDFVKDYAVWRYQSVGETQTTSTSRPMSMPRHLKFRLHNLIVSQAGVSNVQP